LFLTTTTTTDRACRQNNRVFETMNRILSIEEEQKFWADLFGVMIRYEERATEKAQKERRGTGLYRRGAELTEIENENI
jgi:uncharacterized protein (DUF2267 family)